ncbi:MAG: hypothetical protein J5666_07045 [Bacilli bacterium]|nr:hypothetical protein [Bacilli bacterium]
MDDKKKKYIIPEAEITEFNAEDIIVTSLQAGVGDAPFDGTEDESW